MQKLTKLILFTLAFALVAPLTTTASEDTELSDIANHTNGEAIQNLVDRGIVSGYPDGTFKPNNPINRAEFMKIVVEALDTEVSENFYNNCFPDVSDQWFAPYVCYGKSYDIVDGYPDGNFKATNQIVYAEALKMIYKAYNDSGAENPTGSEWYAPFLEDIRAEGLGIGATAGKTLTRGDVAQLTWNILSDKLGTDKELTEEEANYINEIHGFSLQFTDPWAGYEETMTAIEDSETQFATIDFSLPETWSTAFPHGSQFSDTLFTITVRPLSWKDQFAECGSDDEPANCILLTTVLGENDNYVFTWTTSWSTSSPHSLFDEPLADLEDIMDTFEVIE